MKPFFERRPATTASSPENELDHLRQENARLRADLRELQDLNAIAPALFGFLSPQGVVLACNDLALEVIDATRDRIVGQPFCECPWWAPLPVSAARVREAVAAAAAGQPSRFDVQYWAIRDGVGGARWVALAITPFRDADDRVARIAATGVDITDRIEARAALVAAVHTLEQERDLRERFVSMLTHDLRSPLSTGKVSAQLIARKCDDPARVRKLASRISDNMDRADRMIRDLLDTHRIKAGERLPLEITACDLTRLASDTLDDLATLHGDRFALRAPASAPGFWAEGALRRVLENLCSNAIKYGSPSAPVTVAIDARGAQIAVCVHNEGTPIATEDLPLLFQPFRRAESAITGRQTGWGIGLTLVRGIVEAHGGSVTVASAAQSGTTFEVVLPTDARPFHLRESSRP